MQPRLSSMWQQIGGGGGEGAALSGRYPASLDSPSLNKYAPTYYVRQRCLPLASTAVQHLQQDTLIHSDWDPHLLPFLQEGNGKHLRQAHIGQIHKSIQIMKTKTSKPITLLAIGKFQTWCVVCIRLDVTLHTTTHNPFHLL